MAFLKGKHNQDIHFDNGSVRQVFNVVETGKGEWYHLLCEDNTEWIINPKKILFVKKWYGKETEVVRDTGGSRT